MAYFGGRLRAARSAILARAEADLDPSSARLRDEAGLLLGAIEGALMTGDDQIVVDMLDWQETSLGAYGLEASVVADALASPLAEFSDEASAALTRARECEVAEGMCGRCQGRRTPTESARPPVELRRKPEKVIEIVVMSLPGAGRLDLRPFGELGILGDLVGWEA